MCVAESECGGVASCVAGRCLPRGATAVIDSARRLLFWPVDMAYLRRDAEARDEAIATLGGVRDAGAIVLLRFSALLPPEATVLEAYVVLERVSAIDADTAIALRAERIADPWDGRSLSWSRQPRIEEVGAPETRVMPAGGPLVRLGVRGLVERWRRRTGADFGVAVVSESRSPSGIAFALAASEPLQGEPGLASVVPPAMQSPLVGPRLELYVK